jgi:hypothetical protein
MCSLLILQTLSFNLANLQKFRKLCEFLPSFKNTVKYKILTKLKKVYKNFEKRDFGDIFYFFNRGKDNRTSRMPSHDDLVIIEDKWPSTALREYSVTSAIQILVNDFGNPAGASHLYPPISSGSMPPSSLYH